MDYQISKVLKKVKCIKRGGNVTSLSPAALIIVQEMGYKWTKIAGPQFWMYKGKTLYELNNE